MLRLSFIAALMAGLLLGAPSSAQVGSGRIAFANDAGVYSLDPDAAASVLLRAGGGVRLGGWSPDGSQIAFTVTGGSALETRLIVMNADGSGEHVVTTGRIGLGRHPWSSDGARVAWGPPQSVAGEIYTASASGGDVRQLTFDGWSKDPPEWSPDGSTLVYSARVPQGLSYQTELFTVTADGTGAPRQITHTGNGLSINTRPAWSPSGGSIAFYRQVQSDAAGAIFVARSDGTDPHRVSTAAGLPTDPEWSPDGTKILFATSINGGYNRSGIAGREIYVVDADGTQEKRLTELGPFLRYDSVPSWSPDGSRILFTRRVDGVTRVWTMNPDGTCEEQLPAISNDGPPAWQLRPNLPPLGDQRCHAISVEATVQASFDPQRAFINGQIINEGTEVLTNVVFDATTRNDASLIRTIGSRPKACSTKSRRVTCRIARLAKGERIYVTITADARRVGIDRRSLNVWLRAPFSVRAAEPLLSTPRLSGEVHFQLVRCTTRTVGRGRIDGTPYRDRICGRRGGDQIHPREGKDVVDAGSGRDVIVSDDGNLDRIACGPGFDQVIADRKDRVARDCEKVFRR